MNTWGSYESVKELAQSGLGFLWSARLKNATTVEGEAYIIKTTEGLAMLGDSERLERESALFLEAAQVQAKVVESGAKHWVKLHEFGQTDAGAFYVADMHQRSAAKIVTRGIRLDAGSLSTLVHAVVDGLIELRDTMHRPHGNLKPSNVLIGGPDGPTIDQSPVLLTDPKPGSAVSPKDAEGDLHALGRLIYELVTLRPMRERSGVTVSMTDDWSRLGSTALQWVDLCTLLMGGMQGRATPDLEEVRGLIPSASTIAKAKGKGGLIAAAALVLIAGGVGTFFVVRGGGGGSGTQVVKKDPLSLPELDQQWKPFVMDWSQWFGGEKRASLAAQIAAIPSLTREKIPETISAALAVNGGLISPEEAATGSPMGAIRLNDLKGKLPSVRAAELPPNEQKAWIDSLSASVRAVREARGEIVGFIKPDESKEWESNMRGYGWIAPADRLNVASAVAEGLSERAESLDQVPGPRAIADGLAAVADAKRILQALGNAAAVARVLENSGDSALKDYFDLVKREGAEAIKTATPEQATDRLLASINDWTQRGEIIKGLLAATGVDWRSLRAGPGYKAIATPLTPAGIEAWLAAARSAEFKQLPDSEIAALEARRGELASRGLKLLDSLKKAEDRESKPNAKKRFSPDHPPAKTREALNAIGKDIAAIGKDDAGKPWVVSQASKGEIDAAFGVVEKRIAALDKKEIIPRGLAESKTQLIEMAKKTRFESPAVEALWAKNIDELSANESLDIGDRSDLLLETWKPALDAVSAHEFLPAPTFASPAVDAAVLAVSAAKRREVALEQVTRTMTAEQLERSPGVFKAKEDYDAWSKAAQASLAKADEAWGLLLAGHVPGEGGAEDPKARASAALADKDLAAAVKPLAERIATVEAIAGVSDLNTLLASLEKHGPGQAAERSASWKRLAALSWSGPDVQGSIKNLDRVAALISKSSAAVTASGAPASRLKPLEAEIVAAGARVWENYAKWAVTLADEPTCSQAFGHGFGVAGVFGVGTPQADAAGAGYNWRVLVARDAVRKISANAGPADQAAAVKAAYDPLEAYVTQKGLAANPEIARLLKDLKSGTTPEAGKTFAAADVGPTSGPLAATMGWSASDPDDGVAVYTAGGHTIVFVTVPVGDGEVLISTREVGVALLRDVLTASGVSPGSTWASDSSQSLLTMPNAEGDFRKGPRVWTSVNGTTIGSAARRNAPREWFGWLAGNTSLDNANAAFKWLPDGVTITPPDLATMPMQYVSPEAALLVARRLGARFPTPAEWAAARALADGVPNLRDSAWKTPRDHYVQQIDAWNRDPANSNSPIEPNYPTGDIFLPAGKGSSYIPKDDADVTSSDGEVFFRSAIGSAGERRIADLVGNVAEFVTTNPGGMDALDKSCGVDAVFGVFARGKTSDYGSLQVVGGSALSPPAGTFAYDAASPQPVDSSARGGYSDVGFRLAISKESGPSGTPLERALKAFEKRLRIMPAN
jgi:hypothetical protein